MRMNLLLRAPYSEGSFERIEKYLQTDWTVRDWKRDDGPDAYAARLAEAHAVITIAFGPDEPPAPALRLVQVPGAGCDAVHLDALPAACSLCNVFEHETGIAEYLVLAMLEWQIRLHRMDSALRRGVWCDGFALDSPPHGELHGKTVGFVGYGHIARETARRLAPFGVRLLACTRSPDKGGEGLDAIAGMDRLDEMLPRCDFVVVACPLTEETRGLFDRRRLALMDAHAVLLNVARGAIVDERALYEACRDGAIGGAVIDTWNRYPPRGMPADEAFLPSEQPFQELDNVVMTPHASGWSDGLWDRRYARMCENLDRLARGEPLLNVVRAGSA